MKRLLPLPALCCFLLLASSGSAAPPQPLTLVPSGMFHPVPAPMHESSHSSPVSDPSSTAQVGASRPQVPEVDRPVVPIPPAVVKVVDVLPFPPAQRAHVVRGVASWYCNYYASRAMPSICMKGHPDTKGFDAYAAAGPRLRAAICGRQDCQTWRGRTVWVNGTPVKLVDWCQCHYRTSIEKVIDLYYDVFAKTGSQVTIRW